MRTKIMRTMAALLTLYSGMTMAQLLDHQVRTLSEETLINLQETYQGQVVLIVNTASKCGYTPQFDGLEALYRDYKDQGLVVLGFPSDNFGRQEFNDESESLEFCRLTYGVQFPMFAHTNAAESKADPLFQGLGQAAGRFPSWNFHKYLLDREGQLIADYPSSVTPDDLRGVIESAL